MRIYHRAEKIAAGGDVSALCFKIPRAIDMSKESWTLSDDAVTCRKCRTIISKRAPAARRQSQEHIMGKDKAKYTGGTVDASTLKLGGDWASDQAIADACALANLPAEVLSRVLKNDVDSPRVPNVSDNAKLQSWGGLRQTEHPPSPKVAAAIAQVQEWAKQNLHTGHKGGKG